MQASAYLERKEDMKALPRIALRRIEHLYYKNDIVYDAMRRMVVAKQVGSTCISMSASVGRWQPSANMRALHPALHATPVWLER